jgi:uncharacterized protein (DUF4415 family)
VLDTGGRERNYMSNVNYTNAPDDVRESLEDPIFVNDLLPSPEEFVRKAKKEKITIAVDKDSLELYKRYAKKHNAKYQTMINGVLSSYADKFLSKQ